MQAQTLITENDKDFLVVSLPTLPELFENGFISSSKKSFVFRQWTTDKQTLKGYQSFRLNPTLIKGRILNQTNRHWRRYEIFTHAFNGVGLPCIKISVSKILSHVN